MLPNVRSYVQEKYSQGRDGAFPDIGSLPRMTPLNLPHVWLPFVGELLDHPVYLEGLLSTACKHLLNHENLPNLRN